MGIQLIHTGTYRARKEYHDDGAEEIIEWRNGGYARHNFEEEIDAYDKIDLEALLKDKPHRIQKGQKYERQFNLCDGSPVTWRTKELFYKMMCKYDLFPEI